MAEFYVTDSRSTGMRLLLAACVLGALVFAWYSVRWQLGNMFAELTSPSRPDAKYVSDYAVRLAPGDPLAWWLAATTEKDILTADTIDSSIAKFEEVVRRSPDDFRWWIELGRAYEQAGNAEAAETAFRRSIELAPNYSFAHWQLANFLLRQNRADEASVELRRAAENNLTYRDQVFSLAWNYFGNDPAKLESLVSDAPQVQAGLARFYAWNQRPADSLRVWNALDEDAKSRYPEIPRAIAGALYETRAFRQAVEFSREADIDPTAAAEKITNGGFEDTITPAEDTIFGWKLDRSDSKAEISVDASVKHAGSRSLRVSFKNYTKPSFYGIWQNVAIIPGKRYRLRFWVRTENLRTGGAPIIEVVNGIDNKIIAISGAFPTGSNEWQQVTVDFETPEKCEAISVRSSRNYCGENCPLIGTIWLDDVEIAAG